MRRYTIIFQAKVYAILARVIWLIQERLIDRYIAIYSDSRLEGVQQTLD